MTYAQYRSFGHTRYHAFVLGAPWWIWLIAIPLIAGPTIAWFLA
jgi:hypothetical protein